MTKSQRQWLWLGAGAVLIALIIYNLSHTPEWRSFSWSRFWASMTSARPNILLSAVATVLCTYVVRAYRWRFLMRPIKEGSLWVMLVGQILGFSSIYLIGRPGEFVRPAFIARKEQVSIASMVAVLILERIFDTLAMVGLFGTALALVPMSPRTAHGQSVLAATRQGGLLLIALTGLMIVGTLAFRFHTEAATRGLLRTLGFLPRDALRHLESFLHSFSAGLEVIRNWRDLLASVALTAALWVLNTFMFWFVFKSVRGGLEQLSWLAAALTAFLAALGLVAQFPGIGGGYQVGTMLGLTELLSIAPEVAAGAAILVWIVVSVPCLILGAALLVKEGLSFKRLKAMAEEERLAAQRSR